MSLDYIRRTYGVPANCTIKSARGAHLRVLVDDRVPGYRGRLLLHPTWQVEYIKTPNDAVCGGTPSAPVRC
jgi:hypothetical protein